MNDILNAMYVFISNYGYNCDNWGWGTHSAQEEAPSRQRGMMCNVIYVRTDAFSAIKFFILSPTATCT